MKKIRYFYLVVCGLSCGLLACVQEEAARPDRPSQPPRLSVEEARAFFDRQTRPRLTRSAGDAAELPEGVFAMRTVEPDWLSAEHSSNGRMDCLDVPACTDCGFRIMRRRDDGSAFEVPAYGKLLVVKSAQTDSMAVYMRLVVPDELYATFYDGDLSDLFTNCDDRGDFSGLELYTTMDGAVAAAARYREGELLESLFMGDETWSLYQRYDRLRTLLRGLHIRRIARQTTRGEGDWDYGGRTCFYDSTGALYYVDIYNGEEYATQDFDGTRGPCINDQEQVNHSGGGGGGGGGSGNNGGLDNPGSPGGPGNGLTDPGGNSSSGGSNSGNDGDNSGDDGEESEDELPETTPPKDADTTILITIPDPLLPDIDPLPAEDGNTGQLELPDETCPACGKEQCICVQEIDCDELSPQAIANAMGSMEMYIRMSGQTNYSNFLSAAAGSPYEHGSTGYLDARGNFQMMEPYTNNETNHLKPQIIIIPGYENMMFIHNHPGQTPCSPGDVTTLVYLHEKMDASIRYVFVQAGQVTYVLYLYDEVSAARFFMSGYYHGFENEFETALHYMRERGFATEEAYLYSLAYILNKCNTGVALLSMPSSESRFRQHEARGEDGVAGYPNEIIPYKCK